MCEAGGVGARPRRHSCGGSQPPAEERAANDKRHKNQFISIVLTWLLCSALALLANTSVDHICSIAMHGSC
jgi:hypothetical protein